MKQQFLLFFLAITPFAFGQQTGINTGNETSTERSAILEIKSTSGGFLIPRLTQNQHNAIANPATGLEVYNTTSNSYEIYNGTAWFSYNTKDTSPSTNTVANITLWHFGIPVGNLLVGTPAAITIPLTVYASTPGSYNFTTTLQNGVSFSVSGNFTTQGTHIVTLVASGTPLSVGSYAYAMKNVSETGVITLVTLDQATIITATGKIWMAYNLGATAPGTARNDFRQYGSIYQWGRGSDGHQLINWPNATAAGQPINGTTSSLSLNDEPGHGRYITSTNDWHSGRNDDLWQGANGINNPCPAGFRVPTNPEWQS